MATKKIIMIGQAPGQHGDPSSPLASKRLADLCGLSVWEFKDRFDRINLLATWPGKRGKGDEFSMTEARISAMEMVGSLSGRRVIFVGKQVARAFQFFGTDYFTWEEFGSMLVCLIPHPSGVNRFWNDPERVEQAQGFLRSLIARPDDSKRS